jgi:hypothetical protein
MRLVHSRPKVWNPQRTATKGGRRSRLSPGPRCEASDVVWNRTVGEMKAVFERCGQNLTALLQSLSAAWSASEYCKSAWRLSGRTSSPIPATQVIQE